MIEPGCAPYIGETARLAAIRRAGVMDRNLESSFRSFIAIARHISGASIASIGVIDDQRMYLLSHNFPREFEMTEIDRRYTLCQHVLADTKPQIVENLRADSRFDDNPFVQGPPYLVFWGGFPLVSADGFVLGALSVADVTPLKFDPRTIDLMTGLANQIVRQIEQVSEDTPEALLGFAGLIADLHRRAPGISLNEVEAYLHLCAGATPSAAATPGLLHFGLAARGINGFELTPLGEDLRRVHGLNRRQGPVRVPKRLDHGQMQRYLAQLLDARID